MKQSLILDFLRVVAITLVFVAHFGQELSWSVGGFYGFKNIYYVSLGGVGVSVFLILSGVLASLGWANKQHGYSTYLYKKIVRIYPLYWMSIPISVAGYLSGQWLVKGEFPSIFPNGASVDFLGSLTGFYSWMGLWGGPYNSPSWFIGLIMSMYILFPVVYRLLKIYPHLIICCIFGFSLLCRLYIGQHGVPFIDQSFYAGVKGFFYRQYGFMPGRPGDWFPFCRLFEFAFGVYLAMVVPQRYWFLWRSGPKKMISFLSHQSFALFLIHYPFLFLLKIMTGHGVPAIAAMVIYLCLMMILAIALNVVDKKIPRASWPSAR